MQSFVNLFKSWGGVGFLLILALYGLPVDEYAVYFCRAIRDKVDVDPGIVDFFHSSANLLKTTSNLDGWVILFCIQYPSLLIQHIFSEGPDIERSLEILNILNNTPIFKLTLVVLQFKSYLCVVLYSAFETIWAMFVLFFAPDFAPELEGWSLSSHGVNTALQLYFFIMGLGRDYIHLVDSGLQ